MCQLPGKVRQIGREKGKLERGESMDGWRQSNDIFLVPYRPGLCHFNKKGNALHDTPVLQYVLLLTKKLTNYHIALPQKSLQTSHA